MSGVRQPLAVQHRKPLRGNLPQNRAALIPSETLGVRCEVVLNFPTQHMRRIKAIG
jgi:hypothetical protein